MEDFNLELLHKFNKFKTEKFSNIDQSNEDQENEFKNYISAAEELIRNLNCSIKDLKTQLEDLGNKLASLRAAKDDLTMEYQTLLMEEEQKVELLKLRLKIGKERSLSQTKEIASLRAAQHEQSIEYRKRLMEEKQKNKELSEEVERLHQLQEVLIASRLKDTKDAELCITGGGHVSQETTKHTKTGEKHKLFSSLKVLVEVIRMHVRNSFHEIRILCSTKHYTFI